MGTHTREIQIAGRNRWYRGYISVDGVSTVNDTTSRITITAAIDDKYAAQYGTHYDVIVNGVTYRSRDVLLNNVPVIFHKEIYATACVAGGFLYWVLIRLDAGIPITTTATFFFVCAIRLLAVRYHISLPSLKQKE